MRAAGRRAMATELEPLAMRLLGSIPQAQVLPSVTALRYPIETEDTPGPTMTPPT